jgi:hypothetical protein
MVMKIAGHAESIPPLCPGRSSPLIWSREAAEQKGSPARR